MNIIGRNIKKYRDSRNWTQEQLAKEAKVTAASISEWESGKKEPRAKSRERLCKALNIKDEDLFSSSQETEDIRQIFSQDLMSFAFREMIRNSVIEVCEKYGFPENKKTIEEINKKLDLIIETKIKKK